MGIFLTQQYMSHNDPLMD